MENTLQLSSESASRRGLAPSACWDFFPRPYHQEEAVTIYHGDCRQIVPLLGRFDLLLTDPPYGINRSGQAATSCKNPKHNRKLHEDLGWDSGTPEKWVFDMLRSHADNAIVWGANYFPQCFEPRMGWLVWDKGQDFSTSDCELAFGSFDKALRRLVLNRGEINRDGSEHPTQKPERLIKWCIEQAGDVQTILDPFAGSGTTGRAAKDLGKKAVLIEREERYCEIAARRLAQDVLPIYCPNVRDHLPRKAGGWGALAAQVPACRG